MKTTLNSSYVLLLLLVVWFFMSSSPVRADYHVFIKNGLGTKLMAHCRSKDDDFGFHYLTPSGAFTWKFRINVFSTTLFYCDLYSGNLRGHFVVFDADRDRARCDRNPQNHNVHNCNWTAKNDGLHFSNNGRDKLEFPWP